MQAAPLPPQRPGSLVSGKPPQPSVSAPGQQEPSIEAPETTAPAHVAPNPAPSTPAPSTLAPSTLAPSTPAPSLWQWPKLTPFQQDKAETTIVDDTPVGPGITTDPGTSIACLPQRLKSVLNKVVARYGSVRVTSTYRPAWRARRGSYHRRCEAVDFRVPGHRPGEVLALVRTFEETGGRKVYWNGLIHVDTGPERSW